MVTIVDFVKRTNKDGHEFNALILQGGLEFVRSLRTGRYYATAKRTSVTSTLDDAMCQNLKGTQIPGSVQRVDCDPYEITLRETGEVLTLFHRWVYLKEGETIFDHPVETEKVATPL